MPSSPPPESSPSSPAPQRSRRRQALWLRIIAWTAASVGMLIVLVVIAATVLLHTSDGRAYLLGIAEKQATAALGVPVHILDFQVHLTRLSVDIDGLRIVGASPYQDPPLLVAPHIKVGFGIASIWRGKWFLSSIRVDQPQVHILEAKNGTSNLPHRKGGGGKIDVFRLGIRHVVIHGGEVVYNDRKIPLEADLQDLNFRSTFHPLHETYVGSLSYRNGRFEAGAFRPIRSDLDAHFEATPAVFRLTQLKMTSGPSVFELAGTVENYHQPQVQAHYEAQLDIGNLGKIFRNPSLPAGVVRAQGTIAYQSAPGKPVLDSVAVQGSLASRRLTFQAGDFRAPIVNVAARYSVADGNASVRDIHTNLLNGTIDASLEIQHLSRNSRGKLNASIRGISLAALKHATPQPANMRSVSLAGVLNAQANASWKHGFKDLVAHVDSTLHGRASRAEEANGVVPMNGAFHVVYTAANKELTVQQSSLRLPQTTLAMNGTVGAAGKRTSLAIRFDSRNLGELESIAELIRTPKNGAAWQPLGLAGTATFHGQVHGSLADPQLTGELIASNLHVRGTVWRKLRSGVELSPSLAGLQNAELQSADHGSIHLDASVHLRKWHFSEDSPFQVSMRTSDLNLTTLKKIAGPGTRVATLPVAGTLRVDLTANGTIQNPMGHGNVSLTDAKVGSQPIDSAQVMLTAADRQVHGKFTAKLADGTIQGNVTVVPEQKTYTAQISADGIQIGQFAAIKSHDIAAKGVMAMHGSGQGTFTNPQFTATVSIDKMTVEQESFADTSLQMSIENHLATAHLASQAANTSVQANATVHLTGNYMTEATLDTRKLPLGPLLAMYAPEEASGLKGETEIHATLKGPLRDKKEIEAHVTIPTLTLSYRDAIQLAATAPLHIDYVRGAVDLQHAVIRGTDTDLEIQGRVPIVDHAPISLLLKGTMDLKIAQLLMPDVHSSGQLQFDINTYGARADPNVEGQVKIVNASFSNENLPIGLRRGNGVLVLTKNRLNIQSFEGSVGGGTVTAQGGVAYRPSVRFDLGAALKGVQMLYPEGVREQISADVHLSGTQQNALLGGRVSIDNLSFTPDFDLMSMIGQFSGGVAAPPARGFRQNLNLNLAVQSTNDMNLVSRTMSIDGTANLRIRGTAAQPVILGRINITGGDLIFNGDRFTLAGGTIEFVNPAQTQPVVNMAINTTIQQYNISMRFNGPVDRLNTSYSSDPSLPAADIINLLAFGQTVESSAANPTPGNQAAMSAVASQVSSQLTSRVAKIAGISQLSINPVLSGGSTQGPAGAIVTIQQRVTGNLFVTFSTNVATTQDQVIMGQYNLSPRTSLSVTRDQNGGFAFDTTFKKSW